MTTWTEEERADLRRLAKNPLWISKPTDNLAEWESMGYEQVQVEGIWIIQKKEAESCPS